MSGSDRTPQHAGLLEPGVSGNLRRSCARRLASRQRAANLATIRAAVIAALKDADYLHIPVAGPGALGPPLINQVLPGT